MNSSGHIIERLATSPTFLQYQRAYSDATGLPLALRPAETWQLPLHGKRKENPWCAMMAARSRTCAVCLQTQEQLAAAAATGPATLPCPYGLCETAVPVRHEGETLGYLQTGQVRRQPPTDAAFHEALDRAAKLGLELEEEPARAAFFKTPVVAPDKMDSISTLLSVFAEYLSKRIAQAAIQAASAEPSVVVKAKEFIARHHTEALSLGQVAEAVHTSSFYFCKLFRKATGSRFTEYLSHMRAEKAKELLLNRNVPISEIAYQSGFQSLTHFNRVFKKAVGESPTEYRNRLPKGA